MVSLLRGLDTIARPDFATLQHIRSQPAPMYQATRHLWMCQAFKVRAGLTPTLAPALDLSNPKAPPDEIVQSYVPCDEIASCLGRRKLDAPSREFLQRFGLYQRKM